MKPRLPGHRDVGSCVHQPMTRLLHWSAFALILIAAGSIIARTCVEESTACRLLLMIHQSAGIAVLALTLMRLVWRWFARVGRVHEALPRMIRICAALGHASLYVVLLALICTGWLMTNALRPRLRFLG